MKKFLAVVGLTLFLSVPVEAGMMCDAAANFEWKSPALNGHCALEWLWSIGSF